MDKPQADMPNEKAIRQVFKDWTSLKALGCHPLANLNIVKERHRVAGYTQTPAGRGLALREVLQTALENLKPDAGPPEPEQKKWRPYIILDEQCVQGRNPDWVAAQLHVSKGTYYTEQKRALAMLADILHKWEEEQQGQASEPKNGHAASRVPFLAPPRPAHKLIGRADLLAELKQRLLNGEDRALTALNGLPGVGKTTLAIELAHDPEVLSHFYDGILWTGLGRQPDVLAALGIWAAAVGVSAEVVANCSHLADRAAAIHAAIGLRRMLLIIDDAWEIEAALAFKVGGPNCAHLVTTRLANVALDFAGEKVSVIRELDLAQGLNLLAQLSPRVVEAEPGEAQILVQSVGGLPLALILMGSYLRKQSYSAQTRRLHEAMTRLQATEARLQLAQPQSPLETSPTLPIDIPLSLQATIGLSQTSLDETAHQALLDLSLFPPKPNTFSEAAALAVMAAPVSVLDTLVDHSLVESAAPDRYTLHQTIADYAALQRVNTKATERLVNYFVQYVETHLMQHEAQEPEFTNILTALEIAYKANLSNLLIRGANAFHPYLETRGLYQLDEQHLRRAYRAAKSRSNKISLAMILYSLGDLHIKLGQFKEAQAYFQQSITLARAIQSRQIEAKALFDLGLASWYRSGKAEDRNYFERAWYLFQELDDKSNQGYALNGLGYACVETGEFHQAKAYLAQALTVCRESGNRRGEGWAHFNLGTAYLPLGDFALAKAEWEQCLAIYREINDRRGEGWLLCNLWRFYRQLGQHDQAQTICEQARQIFVEIGDYFGQGFATHDLGLIASDRGDEAAITLFRQSLQLFLRIGCRTGESQNYHSLGVWHRRHGDYAQAISYLERALKIRREISYSRGESKALVQLGLVYSCLEERQLALDYCWQGFRIAQNIDARPHQAYTLTSLGHVLTGLGRLDEATVAYQQTIVLRHKLGQFHLALEPQAGLARVLLERENLPQAQIQVDGILAYLAKQGISPGSGRMPAGIDDPDLVLQICCRVLQANHDPRAQMMSHLGVFQTS